MTKHLLQRSVSNLPQLLIGSFMSGQRSHLHRKPTYFIPNKFSVCMQFSDKCVSVHSLESFAIEIVHASALTNKAKKLLHMKPNLTSKCF